MTQNLLLMSTLKFWTICTWVCPCTVMPYSAERKHWCVTGCAWWMGRCLQSVSMKASPLLPLNVLGRRQRRRLPTESLKWTALERRVKVKQSSAEYLGVGALSTWSINGESSISVLQWCRGRPACVIAGGGRLAQCTPCPQCHLSPWSSMYVCVRRGSAGYGKEGEGKGRGQKTWQTHCITHSTQESRVDWNNW